MIVKDQVEFTEFVEDHSKMFFPPEVVKRKQEWWDGEDIDDDCEPDFDENAMWIRGKWLLDGATTLKQVSSMLRRQADEYVYGLAAPA